MSKMISSPSFASRQAFARDASLTAPVRIEGATDNVVSAEQLENDLIIVAIAPDHWRRGHTVLVMVDSEELAGHLPVLLPMRWEAGLRVTGVLNAELARSFANQHICMRLVVNFDSPEVQETDTTIFDFAVQTPRVRIAGAVESWKGLIPLSVALEGTDLFLRLGSDRRAGEVISLYGTGSAVDSSWVEHIEIKEADLLEGLRVHLSPQMLTASTGGYLTIFYTVLVLGNRIQGRQSTFEIESRQPRPFFPVQKRHGPRDSSSFSGDLDAFIQPYEGMAANDRLTFSVGRVSDAITTQYWLYSERSVQPEEVGKVLHWHVPREHLPFGTGVLSVLIERGSGLPVIGLMDLRSSYGFEKQLRSRQWGSEER